MKVGPGSEKKRLGRKLRLASLVLFGLFSFGGCCNWECYSLKPDVCYCPEKGFYDRRPEVLGCLRQDIQSSRRFMYSPGEAQEGIPISVLYRFGN